MHWRGSAVSLASGRHRAHYAPANVAHGGEILGGEAVVFIDVCGPPSERIRRCVAQMRAAGEA